MSPYCLRPLWGSTFTFPSLSTGNLTVTWILIRDVCPLWIPYLALVVKSLGPCYVHVLSVRIMYSYLWMRYFRWIKGVLMWCPEYDIFVPIIVPRLQSWLCTGVPELRHNCVWDIIVSRSSKIMVMYWGVCVYKWEILCLSRAKNQDHGLWLLNLF